MEGGYSHGPSESRIGCCGVDSSGSGQRLVAGCGGHGFIERAGVLAERPSAAQDGPCCVELCLHILQSENDSLIMNWKGCQRSEP